MGWPVVVWEPATSTALLMPAGFPEPAADASDSVWTPCVAGTVSSGGVGAGIGPPVPTAVGAPRSGRATAAESTGPFWPLGNCPLTVTAASGSSGLRVSSKILRPVSAPNAFCSFWSHTAFIASCPPPLPKRPPMTELANTKSVAA